MQGAWCLNRTAKCTIHLASLWILDTEVVSRCFCYDRITMSFCAYFFVKVFPEQPQQLSQLTLPLAEFKTACFSTSLLTLHIMIFLNFSASAHFGSTYTKIGTIQRRLAWP